jgi:hypothetical protein
MIGPSGFIGCDAKPEPNCRVKKAKKSKFIL